VDLAAIHNVVMLASANAKATLVVLFFMHVRWGTRLTWVIAASGFFWLLILFGLTMQDYLTRGWVDGTWK
jgi:cytochrome c oxidase subunit 4